MHIAHDEFWRIHIFICNIKKYNTIFVYSSLCCLYIPRVLGSKATLFISTQIQRTPPLPYPWGAFLGLKKNNFKTDKVQF